MAFIKKYRADNGNNPNFQEMADAVGYASKQSISTALERLEKSGRIERITRGNVRLIKATK